MSSFARRLQQAGGAPSLFLTPAKGNFTVGSTFTVQIRENSGSNQVNSVQANLTYSQTLLQFVSADTTGSPFTTTVQNSGGSGVINLGVGLLASSVGGDQLVGTITFKVLASGTAAVAFDTGSGVASAASNTNICQVQTGATYSLGAATPVPTLYLTPASGSYSTGSSFTVQIREDSQSQQVNSIQADLTYPQTLLQFVSADTTGSPFTTTVQNSGGSGTINLGVGILAGSTSGDQLVGTITFNVLAAGTAAVAFSNTSGIASADTSTNICQAENGASFTLS
ncbi:MAG TPA: cohesin domain-containing protein [Candidatus Saccharimonadales bacterium]|nr:cohesin domain-containing protein [Candidatus Saccharimonadales bacterium]